MVLEVTLSHEEHIISLLSSKKNDLRKERSQLPGINCWFWNWFAVCPRTLQNSWTNSAAHCCWPFWKWQLICGKQDTSVAGRTTPGAVSYSFRKFRVLHTRHVSPKIIWDYTVVFYIWTIWGGVSSICPKRGCTTTFLRVVHYHFFSRILVIIIRKPQVILEERGVHPSPISGPEIDKKLHCFSSHKQYKHWY